jgi:hypothetical protein
MDLTLQFLCLSSVDFVMPRYRDVGREAEEICLYDRAMLRYDKKNISIGKGRMEFLER